MYNISHDDYIFSSEEFLKDRLTYDVLWYARFNAEILKSDCKSFIICRSNDSFPAIVWIDDNITDKDFNSLAFCLKQVFRGKVPYVMVKESFAERIKGVFNPLKVEKQTGLVAYVMDKLPAKLNYPKGEVLRNATEKDKDVLIEYIKGFQTDCFGSHGSSEEVLRLVENRITSPDSYIYDVAGVIVGMISCGKKSEGYCRIQAVYITPKYRNFGYGIRMTLRACEKIFEQGYKPNLFADAANPVSNHIYKKAGFKEVGRLAEIKMGGIQ
jgi:predicted GNAT family acetyltransferase